LNCRIAVRLFIIIATALGVSFGIDPEGDGSDARRPSAILSKQDFERLRCRKIACG